MRAVVINCTLKRSPETSNTEALAAVVEEALRDRGVEVESIRAVDLDIPPGVATDQHAPARGQAGAERAPEGQRQLRRQLPVRDTPHPVRPEEPPRGRGGRARRQATTSSRTADACGRP